MTQKDRRRHPRRQEHQPALWRREGADRHLLQRREHEIRSIIGPNGAGKSSMLNCINGVYTPSEGSITFRGKTFDHMNSRQVAEMGVGAPSRTWRCSRA
jgi:ABC-type branched-subunit amino acid transport system ATPase component